MNIEALTVYGVHSLVWHNVCGDYSAPILEQLSQVVELEPALSHADLQPRGRETLPLDVSGCQEQRDMARTGCQLHQNDRFRRHGDAPGTPAYRWSSIQGPSSQRRFAGGAPICL